MPTNTYDPTDSEYVGKMLEQRDQEIAALRAQLAAAHAEQERLRAAGIALLEANRLHAYSGPEAAFALMSAEMAMRDALATTTAGTDSGEGTA